MPRVSIILPTFNRGDTIQRAIESILRQTLGDWELIVVDDGSTDGTADAVRGLDERITIVSQSNQGCYAARNAGLRRAEGRFVTFMDSDDEWLPHFLEITVAFLEASPDDQVVTTEFLEDHGRGPERRQDLHDIAVRFTAMAKRVGSRLVDLPEGEADDYLRVYSTREELAGAYRAAAERAGHPEARLYRGRIFEHLRFGHLGWLPTTVVRREALATVGEFLPSYRTAADYRFLGLLYRHYRANMIAIPGAIKHTLARGGAELAEGHLASGAHEYRFAIHRLPLYDEFFWHGRESDDELRRIRGLYELYAGRVAARLGKRREAIQHLEAACAANPSLWSARALEAFFRVMPSSAAGVTYRAVLDLDQGIRDVVAGRLPPGALARKALRRARRALSG